jgi:methyl-accepting chemotaxis protein
MVQEILIAFGAAVVGALLAAVVLYNIGEGRLTSKLYLKLLPGLFILVMDAFIIGKIGVNHVLYSAIGLVVGICAVCWVVILASQSLKGALKGISLLMTGTDQVAAASAQILETSQSLAEGAAAQSSSLEETSSSLEEMSSMTKQNADNANQAKAMMTETKQIVEKVDSHMQKMAAAIIEITKTSEDTGKIIKTIDEIAFQTNLLALNAAVEAARAGEAGSGFAVVANEVRNLALRAAEAARNTNSLIDNTIKAVKQGNELTTATQEASRENVAVAGKVAQLIDEIAQASSEQALGIDQINKAVSEMDKVTQRTTTNATESATASQEMAERAEQMQGYIKDLALSIGWHR